MTPEYLPPSAIIAARKHLYSSYINRNRFKYCQENVILPNILYICFGARVVFSVTHSKYSIHAKTLIY